MTIEDERRARIDRETAVQMRRLLDPTGSEGRWFGLFLLALMRSPTPTETSDGN